jgi:hypothetical protein
MKIRLGLRAAVAGAVDKYGDFAGIAAVDKAAARQAGAAIDAYLQAWPNGRYAASAQGLRRRVLWLSGETDALAERYEALLRATPGSQEAAADLAEEIDNTLLQADGGAQAIIAHGKTPLLMAIADLKAMRPGRSGQADAPARRDAGGTGPGLCRAGRSLWPAGGHARLLCRGSAAHDPGAPARCGA